MRINRIRQLIALTAALVTIPACAGNQLGTLGEVLGGVLNPAGGAGGQQSEVVVEVQGVDAQRQSIDVRTQEGETGTVLFDQNTVVVYQQQQYSPAALERGDVVRMQIQQIDQNRLYTPRIDVQQSVQERSGQSGNTQRQQIAGRVGQIDHQRGFFDLQTQQATYTVFLPANAGQANIDYFHRLQTGQSVTIEATASGGNRLELYRFR